MICKSFPKKTICHENKPPQQTEAARNQTTSSLVSQTFASKQAGLLTLHPRSFSLLGCPMVMKTRSASQWRDRVGIAPIFPIMPCGTCWSYIWLCSIKKSLYHDPTSVKRVAKQIADSPSPSLVGQVVNVKQAVLLTLLPRSFRLLSFPMAS